jgi:lactoylglutathione lyase
MKRIHYAIVFVSDMKRSVEFYRDALGLALRFESENWTEFATEGTTLALHPADAPSAGTAKRPLSAGSCHPGFQVDDIDAFHQDLAAKGARCIDPPKLRDFGAKLAVYADPDGLPISISEAPKGRP